MKESVYSKFVNSPKSLTLDNAKYITLYIYTIQMYVFDRCPTVFLTTLTIQLRMSIILEG